MVKFKFVEEDSEDEIMERMEKRFPSPLPIKVIQKPVKSITNKDKSNTNKDALNMDQIRGLFVWICKKSAKHDSTHTKAFLINEIKKVLDLSR